MSVDPLIADRLRAEAENSPLRARRIDIASHDDEFEFMFDQGFSDGLPLVPPTPERVIRMLGGTQRDSQEVIAVMPPNMGEATVRTPCRQPRHNSTIIRDQHQYTNEFAAVNHYLL